MDDSVGKNPGDGENAENKAAPTPQSTTSEPPAESKSDDAKLPVVWSPKLDAGDSIADDLLGAGADADDSTQSADAAHDESYEPSGKAANDAASSRTLRFGLLAASLAAAAALGSLVGSLSSAGVAHFWPAGAANASMAYNGPQAAKAELAELSALKANLDGVSRNANGQFAKLAERLDRVERAQAEPAAKLAHIVEALDRLEKKSVTAPPATTATAPETTGTIATNSPAPPAPQAEAKPPETVLREWIVQDVRSGHALVENRFGALFDVTAGSTLPGLGKVETIKRQDNHWIVVTARGLIYSAP
jgi:hypothetical protein